MELSEERVKELKEAFDLYDDSTGYIGMTALRSVLLCLGIEVSADEIISMMNDFGEEKDLLKKINYQSFLKMMMLRTKESDIEDELIEAFKSFDKKGDGKLGFEEVKYMMLCLGENFLEEEILEIINQTDVSGKGYIDYQDFVKILLTKG